MPNDSISYDYGPLARVFGLPVPACRCAPDNRRYKEGLTPEQRREAEEQRKLQCSTCHRPRLNCICEVA